MSCNIIPLGISQNNPLPKEVQTVYPNLSVKSKNGRCGIENPEPTATVDSKTLEDWNKNRKSSKARFLWQEDLRNNMFVGLALSGGGSRAANFSAAVLFELEKIGILPNHITAISSVSGGSLTAGYYGLYLNDRTRWNPETVYDTLGTNFENWALATWFISPMYFPLTLFSAYDRSDVMADVFDRWLYEKKTFQDLDEKSPIILINASLLSSEGCSFLFTQESLNNLGSEINSYPISNAVMASAAFPGFFNNVTLTNHYEPSTNKVSQLQYRHLYDGGPSDNLGIDALLNEFEIISNKRTTIPPRCLLIVVDAYTKNPEPFPKGDRNDPRDRYDYFVDSNLMFAADTLLTKARTAQLQNLGLWQPGQTTFTPAGIGPAQNCAIWHLTLQHLLTLEKGLGKKIGLKTKQESAATFASRVNQIQTRLKIETHQQEDLITAAKQLIYRDQVEPSSLLQWHQPYGLVKQLQESELKQSPVTIKLLSLLDSAARQSVTKLNPEQRLTHYNLGHLTQGIQAIIKNGDLGKEPEFSNLPGADRILTSWASPASQTDAEKQKQDKNLQLLQLAFPEAFTPQDGFAQVCKWLTNNQVHLQGCQSIKEQVRS